MSIRAPRDIRGAVDPVLKQELERLWDAIARIAPSASLPALPIQTGTKTMEIRFGSIARIDIASPTFRAQLPKPLAGGDNRLFGIAKSGAAALTVEPPPGSLVNSAATISLTTSKLYLGWFDGQNYWVTT